MSLEARKDDPFHYDMLPVPEQRVIQAIYDRLGNVVSKIDTLSNRVGSLEQRAASIDSRLSSLESRMSSLEDSLVDIKSASQTALEHLKQIMSHLSPPEPEPNSDSE